MKGSVLYDKSDGRKSLHIPDASIQIFVCQGGGNKLIIAAYRTDGFRNTPGNGVVRTTAWLEAQLLTLGEVDVPREIVDFAVHSERRRQEEVEGLSDIFAAMAATMSGDSWQEPAALTQAIATEPRDDSHTEYNCALEVQEILDSVRGPL